MARKGPKLPVTQSWRAEVVRKLAETGVSRNELGRRIGTTGATISRLLGVGDDQINASKLVRPISEELEIRLPLDELLDPLVLEAIELLAEMDDATARDWIAIARRLVKITKP